MTDSRTDGQVAYEAYAEHVGSEEYELLTWDQLSVTAKAGWETAAEVAIQAAYAREMAASMAAAADWLDVLDAVQQQAEDHPLVPSVDVLPLVAALRSIAPAPVKAGETQ